MADDKISDDVFNALIENTRALEENNVLLETHKAGNEKKDKKDKNVIGTPKVSGNLTSDERNRYANIGQQLFAPILSSLDKMLKKEKKKSEMLIKDDEKAIKKGAKEQYKEDKPKEKKKGSSWWKTLLAVIAVAGLAVWYFWDEIKAFFGKVWDWIKIIFWPITMVVKAVIGIVELVGAGLKKLWGFVSGIFSKVGDIGKMAWGGVKSFFGKIGSFFGGGDEEGEGEGESGITKVVNMAKGAVTALWDFTTGIFSKIGDFGTAIWDGAKDLFASIGNFFSPENGESPIGKILNICKDAMAGLWNFIKSIFNKIGNFGKTIWDGISKAWSKFITGPDGILNFGAKVVKGIIGFASNAISWIGNAIKSAIMAPINMIFGGAEDEGKAAGEAAADDVSTKVNQAAADQEAKSKAITDKAIYSAESADKAIMESAAAQREAATARAKEHGLQVTDGKVSDDAIKEAAAKAGLDAYIKANNLEDVDPEEYNKYKQEFMKFVEIKDGEAKVNMEDLKNHLKEVADQDSSWITSESDFVDGLQNLTTEQMNGMNASVNKALEGSMQVAAELNAANNLENMSDEEKFEMRLQQAIESGKSAEFRFAEGRKMILDSTATIKAAFEGYDDKIRENFTSTWTTFVKEFMDMLEITINTISPQDNSRNSYTITPLHKETFLNMASQLVSLAQASLDVVTKQNEILDEICILLGKEPPEKDIFPSFFPQFIKDKVEDGVNHVAHGAKGFMTNLADAVTFWD